MFFDFYASLLNMETEYNIINNYSYSLTLFMLFELYIVLGSFLIECGFYSHLESWWHIATPE